MLCLSFLNNARFFLIPKSALQLLLKTVTLKLRLSSSLKFMHFF